MNFSLTLLICGAILWLLLYVLLSSMLLRASIYLYNHSPDPSFPNEFVPRTIIPEPNISIAIIVALTTLIVASVVQFVLDYAIPGPNDFLIAVFPFSLMISMAGMVSFTSCASPAIATLISICHFTLSLIVFGAIAIFEFLALKLI